MKNFNRAYENLVAYGSIDNVFDLLELGNGLGLDVPKNIRDNFLSLGRNTKGEPVIKLYRQVNAIPFLEELYRKARLV